MHYDVIVIGVGSMGSSTAYNLAERGARVLGLEQFNIGHELGSSAGVNRIIRLAYSEHPAYVPLLRRSYKLWRKLERATKERLLFITGGIDAGPERGAIVQGSLASCREHHLDHEYLGSAELQRRFPGFVLPRNMVAIYQRDGGFVLSEKAIITYVAGALALGADIRGREAVRRWEIKRNRVVVHTNKDSYSASKVVITAGPWAGKLLSGLGKKLLVPERQVLLWTQPRRPELFRLGAFPIFNMETAGKDVRRYYGFPVYGIPGFKIGRYHHLGQNTDPDRLDRECHPEDEQVLRTAIRRYFPAADGPTVAMKACMFTNTTDEHFVLDHHPEWPQVSVAAGFSGHGFKFSSVVGEIMADFALNGGSKLLDHVDLFRLRPERLHAQA